MIDEKKITEAVDAYIGYPKEVGEGVDVSMRRDAFREGVKWFKETLWHDTLIDKPKDNAPIAILYEELTFVIDVLRNYKWEVVKSYAVKWCYLSDLLPKGGDK